MSLVSVGEIARPWDFLLQMDNLGFTYKEGHLFQFVVGGIIVKEIHCHELEHKRSSKLTLAESGSEY